MRRPRSGASRPSRSAVSSSSRKSGAGANGRAASGAGAVRACCGKIHADAGYAAECNWFVWKVADALCRGGSHGFGTSKEGLSADAMIDVMRAGNGWAAVPDAEPDAAIRLAAQGKLVIAGMRSDWFEDPQAHGHLAVVIGARGEYSATAKRVLPCGYAGSSKAAARIPAGARRHLGWSFPAGQWKSIGYWYRAPDSGA